MLIAAFFGAKWNNFRKMFVLMLPHDSYSTEVKRQSHFYQCGDRWGGRLLMVSNKTTIQRCKVTECIHYTWRIILFHYNSGANFGVLPSFLTAMITLYSHALLLGRGKAATSLQQNLMGQETRAVSCWGCKQDYLNRLIWRNKRKASAPELSVPDHRRKLCAHNYSSQVD